MSAPLNTDQYMQVKKLSTAGGRTTGRIKGNSVLTTSSQHYTGCSHRKKEIDTDRQRGRRRGRARERERERERKREGRKEKKERIKEGRRKGGKTGARRKKQRASKLEMKS